MKGIILAGGKATRLRPLTKITSKQLLPVYNKPMIYYPIETLVKAGIKDILIIVAPDYSGHFLNLLGSGRDFGVKFTYEIQEEPRGLADAFIVGKNFIGDDNVTMILGDNIFIDDFSAPIQNFSQGAHIFLKEVEDPERYGVAEINDQNEVLSLVEKPENPKSNLAVVGLYIFDNEVVNVAENLQPSPRGEIEITDINKAYLDRKQLTASTIKGMWEDAGTFDSLLKASQIMQERAKND